LQSPCQLRYYIASHEAECKSSAAWRDLPDFEALEDAGLLSKEKLLSGDIMPGFASKEERDALLQTDE